MNLICFPHYTCGGLLCDIFNNSFSPVGKHGGIQSVAHSIGKIGDTGTVLVDYDANLLLKKFENMDLPNDYWIGTHCWPGILDLSIFDQVLLISTNTSRSKLYRWTRAYYLYYQHSEPWVSVSGQQRIDKERETAKNYIIPFESVEHNKIINIEFSEIVETTVEFRKLIENKNVDKHMERWKQINHFLYDSNIWNSDPFKRFYEAELEILLNKSYVYE